MDRQRHTALDLGPLAALLLVAALALHCGPRTPKSALTMRSTLRKSALGYAVALHPRGVASIELGTSFELVLRSQSTPGSAIEIRRVFLEPPEFDVLDLSYDAARSWFWVASTSGLVRAFDMEGKEQRRWSTGMVTTAVAVAQDLLIVGSADGSMCLRRISDDVLLQCVSEHEETISALLVAGNQLLTASFDGSVVLWSLPGLTVLDRHRGEGSVNALALDASETLLAVARSHEVPVRTPEVHAREAGGDLGVAQAADRIEIWNLRGGRMARTPMKLRGHRGPVTAVAWLQGELVSAGWDRTVRLWRIDPPEQIAVQRGFSHLVRDVVASPDGRFVAVGAWSTDSSPAIAILERSPVQGH